MYKHTEGSLAITLKTLCLLVKLLEFSMLRDQPRYNPWSILWCYLHYNIWGCMCSTGPLQYIFPWLCVWDVCYIIFCYLLHIHSGKTGICFHYYYYYCAVYDECKWSDAFWLEDRIRLFVHYTISLSSMCNLIWRHWTHKMTVRYILSSVWVR